MQLRPYQTRAVENLFSWWTKHQGSSDACILSLPTAAGKSVICAEIVRTLFYQYPDFHPRTLMIVPSKELAEQNAEKLTKLLPKHISVGFVSASLGKKQYGADVIVATIGSVYKHAHLLGNIKIVLIDECHLVSNSGSNSGMYRKLLSDLAEYCEFRIAGLTASPFRGNQVWLTDGNEPLFTGVACNVTMKELLDAKFIAPLVPPSESVATRIDASGVGISNGDYKVGELSDVVEQYLSDVALESARIAQDRLKWIAFTPSVSNAESLCDKLNVQGIKSVVVCGETPKQERERLIRQFRRGELRCLVTVLALSVGFDVPDVDCIIWCRPTKSPVLYVQGMGRGVRIHPGKEDCLVLDFTDTVERMGPVDTIRGRAMNGGGGDAPFCICPECGERNHAAALDCVHCGAHIKDPEPPVLDAKASRAALLSMQLAQQATTVTWHDITKVRYAVHQKEGKPDSLRVDYYAGLLKVASEWVCFDHGGFARQKAEQWWSRRCETHLAQIPQTTSRAYALIDQIVSLSEPTRIATRLNGKFTEVVSHDFN